METDPTLEFEHYLAAKLGMTVDRLRVEMSSAEFARWSTFYAREAQRKQLAAMMGGGDVTDAIKIDGLAQFVRNLKKLDADLPKMLRVGFNDAADIVVVYAKGKMAHRSGRAAGSVRASSTRTAVRVSEGGKRAAYVPWLDFGGAVGRKRSVRRAFLKEGRFLYPALTSEHDRIMAAVEKALLDAVAAAGIEVD